MNTSRRQVGKTLTAVALGVAALGFSSFALAADTIKVGVLHSLSGRWWSTRPRTGRCSPRRPSS
jgi:hypothetical protein